MAARRAIRSIGAPWCGVLRGELPRAALQPAGSPFVYVRLQGPNPHHPYGSYTDDGRHWWHERIRDGASQSQEANAYLNNDGDANAVRNAQTLAVNPGR
ncbi:MAG: DUF72 domain-containing protein [Candidatus Nanopelagicales bacterium]